jgi:hypothetical protein
METRLALEVRVLVVDWEDRLKEIYLKVGQVDWDVSQVVQKGWKKEVQGP